VRERANSREAEQCKIDARALRERTTLLKDSESLYVAALEANPTNALAWYGQGVVLRKREVHGRAIECFMIAIDLDPQHGRLGAGASGAQAGAVFYNLSKVRPKRSTRDKRRRDDATSDERDATMRRVRAQAAPTWPRGAPRWRSPRRGGGCPPHKAVRAKATTDANAACQSARPPASPPALCLRERNHRHLPWRRPYASRLLVPPAGSRSSRSAAVTTRRWPRCGEGSH
jgi:hypothetical protein